jgi:hypothetical protein
MSARKDRRTSKSQGPSNVMTAAVGGGLRVHCGLLRQAEARRDKIGRLRLARQSPRRGWLGHRTYEHAYGAAGLRRTCIGQS